jgi:hypothetical protein
MIADCRDGAHMEGSGFVTDARITEWLNQELAALWNVLLFEGTQPFYRAQQDYTVTPATSLQALPASFLEVQQVEVNVNGAVGCIMPFMPNERAWLRDRQAWLSLHPLRYRIQAVNIEFLPALFDFTATLFYSPSQPRLVDPADTFDGFNGYEVAAIYGVTAKMLAKESSHEDAAFWRNLKAEAYEQIRTAAARRDVAYPDRVQDVMGDHYADGFDLRARSFG